jgi:hypothetical protein
MNHGPQLLLIGAVAAVGVLHTIVPDHWVPITLIARQRGWTRAETLRAALQAGTGHVASTLAIALVVWWAGVTVAERLGHVVDTVSSLALVAFGAWIALSAWRELRSERGHGHSHRHHFPHLRGETHAVERGSIHGPELQRISIPDGVLELSIFESGVPPRFRLSGVGVDGIIVQTRRDNGERQDFRLENRGTYWESVEEIPEPHQFGVSVTLEHDGHVHRYETQFIEHSHDEHNDGSVHAHAPEDDPLFAPMRGTAAALLRHIHTHSHGVGAVHTHWHEHTPDSSHAIALDSGSAPPVHEHRHKTAGRTALLLILGSSPMVEGIPAFFAAAKYGVALIAIMAVVFGLSTIVTYAVLCVSSTASLRNVRLGAFERYGEVLSGGFIALVGLAFWIWPLL